MAATVYVKDTGRTQSDQAPVAYISTGIALLTFTIILLYHTFLRLQSTTVWKKMTEHMMSLTPRQRKGVNNNPTLDQKSINKTDQLR